MRLIATFTAASLAVSTLALGAAPAQAEPGGCLKYGAAGAAGGHLAHHGVLGAAGGCVTGMIVRHHYRHEQRLAAQKAAADKAAADAAAAQNPPAAPMTPMAPAPVKP
jgi:hypothetical protein